MLVEVILHAGWGGSVRHRWLRLTGPQVEGGLSAGGGQNLCVTSYVISYSVPNGAPKCRRKKEKKKKLAARENTVTSDSLDHR